MYAKIVNENDIILIDEIDSLSKDAGFLPFVRVNDEIIDNIKYSTELKYKEYDNTVIGYIEKTERPLKDQKQYKIKAISLNPKAPVTINGVTFNGGDSSASAISGAVALAKALDETEVKLWDINNEVHTYSFEDANTIAAQIAKVYRDKQLQKYELIAKIKACTTQEELDAIEVI